ncbi:hypothetical protein MVEN_00425700 [Mycena venus]|uniref:Uncharacterized protein n=1 Tax=Mycena venus TaxID=2733690 RepID=A0A8H6YX97_9AGAR|nr:hypothetical protein MVEN_00425700 [Mycena venus]
MRSSSHFNTLQQLAEKDGEAVWKIPSFAHCETQEPHLKGAVSIIDKLEFYLTDPVHPHSYAVLSDGTCLFILKRSHSFPSFYISAPIEFTNSDLIRILAYPFLIDAHSTLDSSANKGSDSPPLATDPEQVPPDTIPSTRFDIASSFPPIPVRFALLDHPHEMLMLHPTRPPLKTFGPISLSSFDAAPRRATVLRGQAGAEPIVLKMAEAGRDDATEREGRIYTERLSGLDGVPKLYAEG